jgi:hypothetical protein
VVVVVVVKMADKPTAATTAAGIRLQPLVVLVVVAMAGITAETTGFSQHQVLRTQVVVVVVAGGVVLTQKIKAVDLVL